MLLFIKQIVLYDVLSRIMLWLQRLPKQFPPLPLSFLLPLIYKVGYGFRLCQPPFFLLLKKNNNFLDHFNIFLLIGHIYTSWKSSRVHPAALLAPLLQALLNAFSCSCRGKRRSWSWRTSDLRITRITAASPRWGMSAAFPTRWCPSDSLTKQVGLQQWPSLLISCFFGRLLGCTALLCHLQCVSV